jgi:UDP-N-acetylglucosamine pyrophosphorylase
MNSFSTRAETLEYLGKYPELLATGPVDFLQSKVPKVREDTWEPVEWPADPDLEWCPPGHGDFYPSLVGSGMLDTLLGAGIRYAFVSNSDNLGATVDGRLLRHLAESGQSFVMEVAERTGADRKGGHLARRSSSGRLLLRESAQCPEADEGSFQDIERHRYFNTNNLWIRLDRLREELGRAGGTLTLPLITNRKTVDPRDAGSPKVVQLEAAMGAAIECLDDAGAVVVTRDRFSPVKGTGDLLALRSDAYATTADHRLVLAEARRGRPPVIELDGKRYKVLADFEALFPEGAPSLVDCESLKIEGPVRFAAGVVCVGRVVFRHRGTEPRTVPAGTYRDTEVGLS